MVTNVFLVILFVATVVFLRQFHPEGAGFERKGLWLLLYHAARLGLVLYITILCYTVGYRTLEILRLRPDRLFNARKTFILCFFFGASLYGIAFTLLGFAGLIRLSTCLLLTIPVLLTAYGPLQVLLPKGSLARAFSSLEEAHANRFFTCFVILAAVGATLLFLVTRVVFTANLDGNIWEHYLHYYRAVLDSGSIQPNEVWHHFYNSKAGGLVFLTNVLSDFFGVQLVSACFVMAAGLIIFDLLLKYCRSLTWAFFGLTLYFTYLFGDASSGTMFRVHGIILGYASFALWVSVWLQQAPDGQAKPLLIASVVSLVYLGFYQPVATAIFPAAFLLAILINVAFHDKPRWRPFLLLAVAVCTGTALVFLTNWMLTGLPEITPLRSFWAIADRIKVQEVFGTGGIEFFLAVDNDLPQYTSWPQRAVAWLHSLSSTMRLPVRRALAILSLLCLLVVLSRTLDRYSANGSIAKPDKFLFQVGAFLLPLGVLALLIPSPSVPRMGIYSVVFITLGIVTIWKRFVDICFGSRLSRATTVVIMVIGMAGALVDAARSALGQLPVVYQYARGSMSLREAMHTLESLGGRTPGTSVTVISDFRKTVDPKDRILSLAYDPGYSYLLPGPGIVSEPTYSLIRNSKEILAATPSEVAAYLKQRGIKHFTLNAESRLFSTIAFTSLFDPREMEKYLTLAHEDRGFFILTWRKSGEAAEPLPDHLLSLLDLKRTGVLHYPFTQRFVNLLTNNGDELVDSVAGFEATRDALQADMDREITGKMLSAVSLETSRALLRRIVKAGKDAIARTDIADVLTTRRDVTDNLRVAERISERELRLRLMTLFTDAIYKEYIATLGSGVASLSRRCDERVPFALTHPIEATCL